MVEQLPFKQLVPGSSPGVLTKSFIKHMTSNDKLQTITLLEEFPIEENLSKLELLDFPVNIFVAANNIIEFNKIEEKIKKYPFVKTVGYWPILSIEDGYWFSAFTKREGIKRIMKELESTNTPFSVLWDAELPHLRKRLFLTEIPKFFSNRKLIRNFKLVIEWNN